LPVAGELGAKIALLNAFSNGNPSASLSVFRACCRDKMVLMLPGVKTTSNNRPSENHGLTRQLRQCEFNQME
jgi:hypothetical protein